MSALAPQSAVTFVSGIDDLPVLSAVTGELLRALDKEDVTTRQILRLMAQDPLLSAKIVRLANSTFYGGLSSASLDQALMRIGFKEVRNVALTSAVVDVFPDLGPGFDARSFWKHCIASGMSAYQVAHQAPALRRNENVQASGHYVAGLLHHLGILLHALHLPKEFKTALDLCHADTEPLYLAERQVIGFDHADSAACLLGRWGFPPETQSAVHFHHRPESSPEEHRLGARVLHVSAMLCHSIQGEQASYEGHVEGFDEEAWFGLGFDADALEPLQVEVQKAVASAEKLSQELFA